MINASKSQVEFYQNGLVSISSSSISRDCANLLIDLYQAGLRLEMLPSSDQGNIVISNALELIQHDDSVQEGLSLISDWVASQVYITSQINRKSISSLYDFAKHLQAFHALLGNQDIQKELRNLHRSNLLIMHKESIGIRFDLPNEHEQLTELHQEFHSFPFGLNASVLWIPLTRISQISGTLEYYPRPHLSDPIPFSGDPIEQERLLSMGQLQEAQKAGKLLATSAQLGPVQYLSAAPGQCFIFSFSLPHASSRSDPRIQLARLTCQARFFDIDCPYFAWKIKKPELWEGLKRPSQGWKFWQEYINA